ncbi:MAG: M48 family metallopeptidase [Candidatus Korobacteraceae bacterium]
MATSMGQRWVLLLTLSAALCGYGLSQDSAGTAKTAAKADTPAPADTPGSMSAPTVPDIPVAPTANQTVPPALKTDAAAKPDAKEGKDDFDFPHDGKIDDVSAIGNRNVGCSKGLGNWYSLESQVRLGKSYAMQVEQSAKVINDPVVSEYINRIAQNLVRNSDAKVPFTVKVLDDDTVNAFALPGGYFYVQSGLILAADNEAELAGVMAHEIGHVAACHAARQQTRGNLAQLATIPLIMMGGGLGYGLYEAAGIGVPLTFMKFQRNYEAQADYLGVQYMYAAGYDPQAFPEFFEKIQAMEKKKPGLVSKAFETHPPTPARMEHTQHEIATILPPRPQYVVDTSEFQDVKARLAALENRRKVDNGKDKGPSLRRASSSTGDGSADGGSSDDRPTLKRRDDQ